MTTLAIIDLDGVVVNADARFAKAEEAKQAYIDREKARFEEMFKSSPYSFDPAALHRQATDLYWQTVFTPELVELDMLIIGADHAIARLSGKVQKIIYLTSRPESMREATQAWLAREHLSLIFRELVMKVPAFQFVKTTTWKAGIVTTLAHLYGADDILFIDDEEANCEAMRQAASLEELMHLWCYHSLEEAVKHYA